MLSMIWNHLHCCWSFAIKSSIQSSKNDLPFRLDIFLKTAAVVSRDHPVVISKYITGAKEVEMDGIGNGGELVNYAIAEHIENAGVHSGDATLLLPAQRLFVETHRRVKSISQKLCKALKISGQQGSI